MVIKEQKHRHVSEDEFIRAEQKRSKETQKHEHLSLYFNLITHYLYRNKLDDKQIAKPLQTLGSSSNQTPINKLPTWMTLDTNFDILNTVDRLAIH